MTFDDGGRLSLEILAGFRAAWDDGDRSGVDSCEVIEVAPQVYFLDLTFQDQAAEAETLVFDLPRQRALSRVAQVFRPGVLGEDAIGEAPHPTRDLIGLTAHYAYSPNHVYEHIQFYSTRYAWLCLRGVQRGHGDVDLATTYKFAEGLYVFTFREFIIPVASTLSTISSI